MSYLRKFLSCVCAVAVALVLFVNNAWATGQSTVTDIVSTSDWTTILADITASLSATMVPILGVSIGLMVVYLLYRIMTGFLKKGR